MHMPMKTLWNLVAWPFRAISAKLDAWDADREEMRRQNRCVQCREPLEPHDSYDYCTDCLHSGF